MKKILKVLAVVLMAAVVVGIFAACTSSPVNSNMTINVDGAGTRTLEGIIWKAGAWTGAYDNGERVIVEDWQSQFFPKGYTAFADVLVENALDWAPVTYVDHPDRVVVSMTFSWENIEEYMEKIQDLVNRTQNDDGILHWIYLHQNRGVAVPNFVTTERDDGSFDVMYSEAYFLNRYLVHWLLTIGYNSDAYESLPEHAQDRDEGHFNVWEMVSVNASAWVVNGINVPPPPEQPEGNRTQNPTMTWNFILTADGETVTIPTEAPTAPPAGGGGSGSNVATGDPTVIFGLLGLAGVGGGVAVLTKVLKGKK
jgi:hypothetical protein